LTLYRYVVMHTTNYVDPKLFDPKQFTQKLTEETSRIIVFRQALEQGHKVLEARFKDNHNASAYVEQRAWLVDQILLHAATQLCGDWENDNDIALIAVGGYGRNELHPSSDIDLMILLQAPMTDTLKECIEHFVMFLWDIKLEVGHSVRTIDECEQEATKDISVATNLIEARLLLGSQALFETMQKRVNDEKVWSSKRFFEEKVTEQKQRHKKFGETGYNLEPNVKDSPGGLRDIQTIGWVAKRHFDANIFHDLLQHGFLTESEYKSLLNAQEFLWEVRCNLHFLAGRREDRLLFDYQRELAKIFGYHDKKSHLAVEQFMKRYYRTIMELRMLNEVLLQLFQEMILYDNVEDNIVKINNRFQIRNDFIEVTHDKVFVNYPFALLEIFLVLQQHPEIKGIRACTIRLLYQSRHLIDEAFHKDLRARSLFYEITRQPRGITFVFRRMNRYGILGAYIPAFGKIVGQMQYDLFHTYTVDQHTLFVVRNLRRFFIPKFHDEFPLCANVAETIPKPELLYLAGLFHDIAKGRGGDHSVLGETDALHFCHKHGMSDHDSRLVAWLVRHHLTMSVTAQRQDISDPEVINKFAQQVQDVTHLDYLYLLTVADIRATNPKLWNSWKDALLADLYRKTKRVLQHGLDKLYDKPIQVQQIQQLARESLTDQDEARINGLWKDLGDNYFLRSLPEDIARETRMILEHKNASKSPLVLKRKNAKGGTEVLFFVRDRNYLFAETTLFLEQQDLNIVDAYIIPTEGACTIGGYIVLERDGDDIDMPQRVDNILTGLSDVLNRDEDLPFCPINRRLPRQLKHFPVPTRINFTQDPINDHTVMEIITTDRPGVLSRIAQAFVICEVRLKKANIGTFGSRVEDVFFITDHENHSLHSADKLDCLQEHLSRLLELDVPKNQN